MLLSVVHSTGRVQDVVSQRDRLDGTRIGRHLCRRIISRRSARGTSLLVPIAGIADLGGIFTGALLVEQFAPQSDGVAAIGTVTGALTANGTVRNLVVQVMLPLDIAASRARLNTDAALAQSSCDVLHIDLAGASINVLGSTIGLNPVAFDIASTVQGNNAAASTISTAAQPATSAATQPATTVSQQGTVTASPSANATQPPLGSQSTPGSTTTAAPQSPKTTTQTSLSSLLCSVDRFRDVSSAARLAEQLNAILAALGNTQG
jgi:hypothetical protein